MGTFSVKALLKHSSKYFLTISSLIRTFISSAGILSIPVALLFFILFIVSTNSFSFITGSSIIPELSLFICSIIFFFSPSFSLYQNVKSAFCNFWYTCSVQSFRNSLLHSIISFFPPSSSNIKASSLSSFPLPVITFIIFQKAWGLCSVSAIILSSQFVFLFWAMSAVIFFCWKYFLLHSSISSSFPLFLAYLHSLLYFDLNSMLSVNSLSTHGAAFIR